LLSYLRGLALLSSRRALGQVLRERAPPSQPFSAKDREARGSALGDVVDSLIENRAVLEKVDVLELKMKYQIDRLVRLAEEPNKNLDAAEGEHCLACLGYPGLMPALDPLAFRPNPQLLVSNADEPAYQNDARSSRPTDDGVYRPPRLAPMPYNETSKKQQRKNRAPVPTGLSTLAAADPSMPHVETTSGLGALPSLNSGRAQYLRRMQDFEEDNFTRLIMKKKDMKQRARDEADLAMGADLMDSSTNRGRRQRAGALEDEFAGILRSATRVTGVGQGDGYEELRQRGKKRQILERSREVAHDDSADVEGPRMKKRSRFEQETKLAKRRLKSKHK